MEEEVSKVTNLAIYKKDVFKNNVVMGIKAALTITAIPLSLTVAKEVFGIDFKINDIGWYADFINTIFEPLSSWRTTVVCGAVTTIAGIIGSFPDTARLVDKKEKQKREAQKKKEEAKKEKESDPMNRSVKDYDDYNPQFNMMPGGAILQPSLIRPPGM